MSMLAERKRKQKWSLNPRGNEWSNDNNKFGQKLMERMGWKEGKGLGAKEDGATEHVRVAYKNDIKGIGFKESIEWSHQQDNFSELLKELNNTSSTTDTPTKIKSLEEKSEKSRARVHYRKFTRGKDLSRYSEKDLANILGQRKLKTNDTSIENVTTDPSPLSTPQFGVNTTVGGSMADYFKNKLPNFISSRKNHRSESESEIEVSYGFGFSAPKTNDFDISSATKKKKRKHEETNEFDGAPSIKKCKGKHVDGLVNAGFDPLSRNVVMGNRHVLETISENDEQLLEPTTHRNDDVVETKQSTKKQERKDESYNDNTKREKKTKKKKTKDIEEAEDMGTNNPCFNPNDFDNSNSTSDYVAFETDTKEPKLKKKKGLKDLVTDSSSCKNVKNNVTIDSYTLSNETNTTDATHTLKKDKSKRRKQQNYEVSRDDIGCFNNPGFVELDAVDTLMSNIDNPYEIKAKKKSKKTKQGIENPSFDVDSNLSQCTTNDNCNDLENPNEFEVKIKSKRKKYKDGVDNLGFTTDKVLKDDDVRSKKKIKQNKKRDKCNEEIDGENTIVGETKRKKSENLQLEDINITTVNEQLQVGIDNPTLNLSDLPNVDDCDLILNVTDEPVQPKTPEVKKSNKNVRFSNVNMKYTFEDPDDIAQRKELSDINTKVIEASSTKYNKLRGLDNAAFNFQSNSVEESINCLTRSLENCQAEVENGINESKVKRVTYEERMIGESNNPDGEDEPHPDGVILRLKNANFSKKIPFWESQYAVASYPKKAYKHLIKGDIVIGFKNTNLHQLNGYGKPFKNKTRVM